MPVIDIKRLAAEVSAQHGIRVDPEDPMMAVVTLNRLILEGAIADIVENLQTATRELQDAAENVQFQAGTRLAGDLRACAAAIREELQGRSFTGRSDEKATSSAGYRQLIFSGLLFLVGLGLGLILHAS
jgi:hypothetical protein